MLHSAYQETTAPRSAPQVAQATVHNTLDALDRMGFTARATHPNNRHAPATRIDDQCGTAIALGRQRQGKGFLYLIDLDQKHDGQDARQALAALRSSLPDSLRYIVDTAHTSPGGKGFHILVRTAIDCSITSGTRITINGTHAGEMMSAGHWMSVPGNDATRLASVPAITYADMGRVLAALGITPGAGDASDRKADIRAGSSLIAGWQYIRNAGQVANTLATERPKLAERINAAKSAPKHARSEAYAALVQSLMLHVGQVKHRNRYALVAAMAMTIGASGKEAERDYNIEKDTAALVYRIATGAPYSSNSTKRFTKPYWCQADELASNPQAKADDLATDELADTPRQVAGPGRRAGDRAKMVERCYKALVALQADEFGRRFYLVASIAGQLKCSTRAVQSYLRELRGDDHDRPCDPRIITGQEHGNGRPYMLICGGASNTKKAAKNTAPAGRFWGANDVPECSATIGQNDKTQSQCNKEVEHQNPYAPTLALADDLASAASNASNGASDADDEALALADARAHPFGVLPTAPATSATPCSDYTADIAELADGRILARLWHGTTDRLAHKRQITQDELATLAALDDAAFVAWLVADMLADDLATNDLADEADELATDTLADALADEADEWREYERQALAWCQAKLATLAHQCWPGINRQRQALANQIAALQESLHAPAPAPAPVPAPATVPATSAMQVAEQSALFNLARPSGALVGIAA